MADFSEIKKGLFLRWRDELWEVMDYQHVKPGKGGAFVKARIKNFKTGRTVEHNFDVATDLDLVTIERKIVEYLYRDGEQFVVMDPRSYEQLLVARELFEPLLEYVRENDSLSIVLHEGKVLRAVPPNFVELQVTEAQEYARGNTATADYKPVVLETGITVKVPPYIKAGEVIKIDTATGEFVSRVATE